ncbi:MAG: HAD family hydrolase [Sulfuricurvum sp.]
MADIVIFDMDGTLIDSGFDITQSINHVRRERYGLTPIEVHSVVDAINAPVRNLAMIFYETPTYEADARAIFEEHYFEQCIQNVAAYDGIPSLLGELYDRRIVMGVATNAPTLFAKRMLGHLGIAEYFGKIIGADEVQYPKPHPEMLLRHLEHHRYNEGTDNAYMIGDNSKDMQAAREAKIKGIFAGWGFGSESGDEPFAFRPLDILKMIS